MLWYLLSIRSWHCTVMQVTAAGSKQQSQCQGLTADWCYLILRAKMTTHHITHQDRSFSFIQVCLNVKTFWFYFYNFIAPIPIFFFIRNLLTSFDKCLLKEGINQAPYHRLAQGLRWAWWGWGHLVGAGKEFVVKTSLLMGNVISFLLERLNNSSQQWAYSLKLVAVLC